MTTLDDRIGNGNTVMVVRYGDSKARPVDIIWAGVADVDLGNGEGTRMDHPVALGVDDSGRDIVLTRVWDREIEARDACIDLVGFGCRDWHDLDGDEPPLHLKDRIDSALNP